MSQPLQSWAAHAPEGGSYDSIKVDTKAKKTSMSGASVLIIAGTFLFIMLAFVPIWNGISLLNDFNYLFWVGARVPRIMLISATTVVFAYGLVALVFSRSGPNDQSQESILNVASCFITLFGLVLLISSMPLSRQADRISDDLLYHCQESDMTHRTYEYSMVLQNIRATPECAKKFSVEDCEGYSASYPYTNYLKDLENRFRCSGFCYPKTGDNARKGHQQKSESLAQTGAAETLKTHMSLTYPPTLFSDANFQASCEGMAARDMKNLAGDIGHQTFFQGVYLVGVAAITGFLKLIGFCVHKRKA